VIDHRPKITAVLFSIPDEKRQETHWDLQHNGRLRTRSGCPAYLSTKHDPITRQANGVQPDVPFMSRLPKKRQGIRFAPGQNLGKQRSAIAKSCDTMTNASQGCTQP
jgi:hypothetical protein